MAMKRTGKQAVKVLVATDGSKYGRWAIEWLACLPFNPQLMVRVLHVVDLAWLHAPFVVPPVMATSDESIRAEIGRMETVAKQTKAEAAALLKSLRLKPPVSG